MATETTSLAGKVRAYSVHVYTALGVAFAFMAAAEISQDAPDARWVFAWLAVAVFIDATDGPLARRWNVKERAARIDGRTIDDILDYLTFSFIPLLLIWKMGWLAGPDALWVVPAMLVSLLGFANTAAKQEEEGFFVGFPSYWNIVAFYVGLWAAQYGAYGPYVSSALVAALAVLTVLPVRFVYPNQAPRPWRRIVLGGAALWTVLLFLMLPSYPHAPAWLMWLSLTYPAFYIGLSIYLDLLDRQAG